MFTNVSSHLAPSVTTHPQDDSCDGSWKVLDNEEVEQAQQQHAALEAAKKAEERANQRRAEANQRRAEEAAARAAAEAKREEERRQRAEQEAAEKAARDAREAKAKEERRQCAEKKADEQISACWVLLAIGLFLAVSASGCRVDEMSAAKYHDTMTKVDEYETKLSMAQTDRDDLQDMYRYAQGWIRCNARCQRLKSKMLDKEVEVAKIQERQESYIQQARMQVSIWSTFGVKDVRDSISSIWDETKPLVDGAWAWIRWLGWLSWCVVIGLQGLLAVASLFLEGDDAKVFKVLMVCVLGASIVCWQVYDLCMNSVHHILYYPARCTVWAFSFPFSSLWKIGVTIRAYGEPIPSAMAFYLAALLPLVSGYVVVCCCGIFLGMLCLLGSLMCFLGSLMCFLVSLM